MKNPGRRHVGSADEDVGLIKMPFKLRMKILIQKAIKGFQEASVFANEFVLIAVGNESVGQSRPRAQ